MTTSGCDLLRVNQGRLEAITIAAQVGEFRLAKGRWPAAAHDLDHSTLLEDFGTADLGAAPARKAARAPRHRVEMAPRGANLRVKVLDDDGRLICRFEVLAPSPGSTRALIPLIVVKTSMFVCPGEGKEFQ
ncbi:MAG: hypothetical protein ABI769_07500 [Pseudomonadota bacterium]